MKLHLTLIVALLPGVSLCMSVAAVQAVPKSRPNIILIMTDDQGYGDLACHGNPPWNFAAIAKLPQVTVTWMGDVKKAGRYRLTLRQWPPEAGKPVEAVHAKLRIAGQEGESAVEPGTKGVVFELDLPAGQTELTTWLYSKSGAAGGAYFT